MPVNKKEETEEQMLNNSDLLGQQIAELAGQLTETNAILRQVLAQLANRNAREEQRQQKFGERKERNFEDRKFDDRPRREFGGRGEGRPDFQNRERTGYQGRNDSRSDSRDRAQSDRPQRGFGRGDSAPRSESGSRNFGSGGFTKREDRGPAREFSSREGGSRGESGPRNDDRFPRRKDHGFGGRGPRK